MSNLDIYRCTPRQVRSHIKDCFYAGLVPFVKSDPGMGKSAIYRSVADELRLKVIDHRISTSSPVDFTGLPRFDADGKARFSPFADLFPLEDTEVEPGKDGWLLFLDEFNSGLKPVMAASYKLLLDKMTGQLKLNSRVAIGLAGNLETSKAIVNQIGTALQSRVITIEMIHSFEEWMEDVAGPQNYAHQIIAYLNYKNGVPLMQFDPNHKDHSFDCPRTWEFMNNLINVAPIDDSRISLYAGTISSGTAVDFVQFCKVYDRLISVDDILADPTGAPVPIETATRWAVISHMAEKVTDKTFGPLSVYANRFDLSFRILFYRMVMMRHPQLRAHPQFASAMAELDRYLNG